MTWGPAPAVFPAGAKMAVESGDPSKSGEFIVRLSFPDGYKIPPHFHPSAEQVRVRSGTLLVGMGDKLDATATKPLAVGDTGTIPAQMHHFAIARGATTVSVRAAGPFAMTYVNPADTPKPSRQTGAAITPPPRDLLRSWHGHVNFVCPPHDRRRMRRQVPVAFLRGERRDHITFSLYSGPCRLCDNDRSR